MKRILCCLLCATLLSCLFVGCSAGGTTTTTAATTAAKATTTVATTTTTVKTTAAPAATTAPVTTAATSATTAPSIEGAISIPFADTFSFSVMSNYSATLGDKWTVVQQELEKRLNVKIDWIKYDGAAYSEALSVTLASQDLPDLIYGVASDASWINFGAIIPIENELAEYAPNYMALLSESDLPYITYGDGHIYGLYTITGFNANTTIMVRRDWIDSLGFEAPVTIADWDAFLTAVKDKDPNGNGLQDEIPLLNLEPIAYAYGLLSAYIEDGDGVIDRYEAPYYLDYVALTADWYERGLIDAEYLTRGQNGDAVRQLLYNDISSTYYGSASELSIITASLRETIPTATLGAIAPMEGPGGRNTPSRAKFNWPFSVSAQAENIDKLITYMDWMFSEEGYLLNNFGIEGEHYDIVNEQPIIREPYCLSWVNLRDVGMNNVSAIPHYWHIAQFQQMAFLGKSADTLDDVTYLSYEGYFVTNNDYFYYAIPSSVYQTKTYVDGGSEIYKSLGELETQVIMGLIKIDELEAAIEKAKADGIDKMVEEANANWVILNG